MFVSALKLQKWLWTRFVLFMSWRILHRKHRSDCSLTRLRCQSLFYKSEKYKLNVIQITCLQKHALKNPMRKESIQTDEERKKKGVATTVGERATTKKNGTDWANGLFTITSVKQYTPKATRKNNHLASEHLAQNEVICPKQNEGLTHIWSTTHELPQRDSLTVEFNEQNFPQGK